MNITLRLSNGRKIALSNGTKLTATDLPGLQSASLGGPVAAVNRHPTDASVQGLQNLSRQSWTVRLANGSSIEIKPGKNVRLTPGTRVSFGPVNGEMVSSLSEQRPPGRSKAWLWAGIGGAALCLIVAGAWHFRDYLSKRITTLEHGTRNEPLTDNEKNQALAATQTQTQEQEAPAQAPKRRHELPAKESEEAQAPSSAPAIAQSAGQNWVSHGIYDLQQLIEFDCLDGATVDVSNGRLSLFGHWANPNRHLQIPYFDYLATALECKAPTFSLEWTPSAGPQVDRVLETGGQAILDAASQIFDDKGKLTPVGAWFLQQNDVPVVAGMSQEITLAWMLDATNHPKTAEVVERYSAWLNARTDGAKAQLALYKALGVDAAYREIEAKQQAGNLTTEQLTDNFYPKFFAALGNGLEADGERYAEQYRESRRKGKSTGDAFRSAQGDITKDLGSLMRRALGQLVSKDKEIPVPRAVVTNVTGGVVPHVYPVFNDLPPRSQLARIAFQADVAGKTLMCAPELKQQIPTYRTEFQFYHAKGLSADSGSGYERCWISPGKFELNQSSDGKTVRFTNTPMKFNVRAVNGASKNRSDVANPVVEQYGDELTAQYDALAREIPVLHDLRESVKIVAIARWLQKRGFQVDLPKEGRTEWSPPAELPGIIHVVLSVKGGKMVASSAAEGGIDLRPDPTIHNGNADKPPSDSTAMLPTRAGDLRNAPAFQDLQSETLHDAVASPPTKDQLLEQRNKATTPEDKARADINLWRWYSANNDKEGAAQWYNKALKDQGQTNAAFDAIRGGAMDDAFSPPSGNPPGQAAPPSTRVPPGANPPVAGAPPQNQVPGSGIRNPVTGGVLTPFDYSQPVPGQPAGGPNPQEPQNQAISLPDAFNEAEDIVHSFRRSKPAPPISPISDDGLVQILQNYPDSAPYLGTRRKERQKLINDYNKADPNKPDELENIRNRIIKHDKETKDKVDKRDWTVEQVE